MTITAPRHLWRTLAGLCAALLLATGVAVSGATTASAANNNEIAWNFFRSKGLSEAQTAGLIGNFIHESGSDPINPAAVQYGGGPGRGLAQWEGSRRTDLENFAAQRGVAWSNLQLQLDFVWLELQGTERNAYNQLLTTSTPADAAVSVRIYYERPSVHADDLRIAAAQRVHNTYTGSGGDPGDPDPSGATAQVMGDGVNVRTSPSLSGSIIGSLPAGPVTIQCQTRGDSIQGQYTSDWWAKVSVNGTTGYATRAWIRVDYGVNVPTC
ncbi:phage tail tip lysozyme [Parenemella sanctibonifatiensis]|uniref:SH3b domain-containing protein n=1 Tax=Parenemella sanctibonifatiensis TaxID=2016505 RepID=A0A255EIY1_9ACTN|nr:phage tail tip lysozyme [Parenemella sanctibonifatiensis]OYN91200.1 hypothetical protein CGZ91_07025 [Parenemella sanctibonifatiensis]